MAGLAFNTQGSTPKDSLGLYSTIGQSNNFLNSYGKALNSSQAPNMSTPYGPRYAPPPAMATPTTPVKKQTVTNTDGSTHTTEYHAPETPSSGASTSTGLMPPPAQKSVQQADGSYTLSAPSNAPVTNSTPTNTPTFGLPQSDSTPTYPGLINNIVTASQPNAAVGQAQETLQQTGKNIQDLRQAAAQGSEGLLTSGMTSPVAQGRAAVVAQTEAAQEGALQKNAELAQTSGQLGISQQQAQQSGLNNAAGLLSPIQVPYSSQVINPATGQPVNSSSSSGDLNGAVTNVVTQLQNGTIGYDDAKAQLAGYGQGGLNALSKWAADNNFNVAQSNTLAAQQGAITPNLNYANAALDNLSKAVSNLQVWGQDSNIPILGGIANWFSTQSGYGKEQTATKAGAVGEAQQAIASVLASVKGGTPTDYGSQARALLPDNPTPADIAAAKANLTALGEQKQSIYGNPGQQSINTNQNAQSNTTNPPGWF